MSPSNTSFIYSAAIEKVKRCDDAFRRQLEQQREGHRHEVERIIHEKDSEIEQTNGRVSGQITHAKPN